MSADAIADYAAKLDPRRADICASLRGSINELLPQATSKLWHGIPVWFIGENPAVGYTARKEGVMLMFWNGQDFGEPELTPSGSFHMAEIRYNEAGEIDKDKLAGWLLKAGTSVWDMVGERKAFVSKRRASKVKAKAKAKARTKPKSKSAKPKKSANKAKKTRIKAKVTKRKRARAKAK